MNPTAVLCTTSLAEGFASTTSRNHDRRYIKLFDIERRASASTSTLKILPSQRTSRRIAIIFIVWLMRLSIIPNSPMGSKYPSCIFFRPVSAPATATVKPHMGLCYPSVGRREKKMINSTNGRNAEKRLCKFTNLPCPDKARASRLSTTKSWWENSPVVRRLQGSERSECLEKHGWVYTSERI